MPRVQDPKTGKFVRTTPDYKAMYEEEKERICGLYYDYKVSNARRCDAEEQRDFLLNHCGPICKWMYKRKFCK